MEFQLRLFDFRNQLHSRTDVQRSNFNRRRHRISFRHERLGLVKRFGGRCEILLPELQQSAPLDHPMPAQSPAPCSLLRELLLSAPDPGRPILAQRKRDSDNVVCASLCSSIDDGANFVSSPIVTVTLLRAS